MEMESEKRPSTIQFPTLVLPIPLDNENHLNKNAVKKNVGLALKKNAYEWTQVTTAHGFVHLGRPNNIFIKLFWSFIIVVSLGYSFYSKLFLI